MSNAPLIKMANHIAANVPARHEATTETTQHIQRFWTPTMIDALSREVASNPGVVSAPVRAALATLRPEGVS
jgi:hypothetical protein